MRRSRQPAFTFATKITVLRIFLVPAFVTCILYYDVHARSACRWWALGIFVAGAFTDALDGYLARRQGQWSRLGAILDPIADKLLLTAAFLALSLATNWPVAMRIPAWVTVLVVSRDVVLVIGTMVTYMLTNELVVQPSRWGKITTVTQMGTIVAVLLWWPAPLLQMCWWLTIGTILISTIGYLRSGSQRLMRSGATRGM